MNVRSLLYLIGIATLVACSGSEMQEVENVDLFPDKEINYLPDSSFFAEVPCLSEYEDDIYMSDKKRCQIFRLDSNLNLLKTIGMQGRGPQDLGYIEQFVVFRDTIFVGDVTKMQILRFSTDGVFCGSENPDGKIPLNQRFSVNAESVYYDTPFFSGKSMADFSRTERLLAPFGEYTDFGVEGKNRAQNKRSVHVWTDDLIVVPKSIPVVEIYDRKTKVLKQTVDVSEIPVVQAMYLKVTNDKEIVNNPNSAYSIVLDSYLRGNYLYVLYSKLNQKQKLDGSAVVVFDLEGGEAKWVKQYNLSDWAVRFCVTDDYVYGFVPQSASIKRYPLPVTN